ncbi:MAG: NUDIX domain-containing protein [Ruminococcus sp.]|nr:NUDIX domain-containing protein [Ruminococcus sp.]
MELFDICDEKGIPTGRVTDRRTAHREGILHRTAHIWIVRKSPDGRTEILLQKRAACKDSFPGEYDTSSAGHITAGDEPLHGALRELSEELGIFAVPEDLHFAADSVKGDIRRFSPEQIPPAAAAQRFLTDPIFMCVELASNKERLLRTVSELPGMATVSREVALQPGASLSGKTRFSAENGRVIAAPSGTGRIRVVAQSHSMEAASELCADWCQRLRRAPSK